MANPILQLLEALRNMFTCDIGIDLGTANTLVYICLLYTYPSPRDA